MDGVISLPIALAIFFLIPDFPDNTRVFYISESVSVRIYLNHYSVTQIFQQDKVLAKSRMQLEGRKEKQPYTRAKVFRILTSWHIWLLPLILVYVMSTSKNGYF